MQDEHTQWPPIEQTTPVPYRQVEATTPIPYPYGDEDIGIPPPPPPPPRKRHVWVWVILLALLLAGGTGYAAYQYGSQHAAPAMPVRAPHTGPTAVPTVLPTATPTAQPTQPHLYTAEDIYNDFAAQGLGGTIDDTPDAWSCCFYRPEGGSMRWTRDDGSQWEVASFLNSQEAHDDAFGLNKMMEGPGTATNIGRCILVSGPLSTDLIPRYEAIMQHDCT